MKSRHLFLVTLLLGLSPLGLGTEEPKGAISRASKEYNNLRDELQQKYSEAKGRSQLLATSKKQIIDASKALAQKEMVGLEDFKRYQKIVVTRYVNDEGVYQPGLILNKTDYDNVTSIFQEYLNRTPFAERASAGDAERELIWGVNQLDMNIKKHADPSEKTHPELEMIAKESLDTDKEIKVTTTLAQRLGVVLAEKFLVADADKRAADQRMPASLTPKKSTPKP